MTISRSNLRDRRIRPLAVAGSPRVGIILGSGLGAVGDEIELDNAIDYGDMPHFLEIDGRRAIAAGCCAASLRGVPVVAMQGRFHCYEGYSAERATFPVRVMKALGIELLIVSNAAGGLNPNFAAGDVMVIDDHINLLNRNPLDRRERRPPRPAISRYVGALRSQAAATGAGDRPPSRISSAIAACTSPCLGRPTKRAPRSACCAAGRRRGRHVDRARSDRRRSRRNARARPVDDHERLLARHPSHHQRRRSRRHCQYGQRQAALPD